MRSKQAARILRKEWLPGVSPFARRHYFLEQEINEMNKKTLAIIAG
ncbi:hypothetical protein [Paenibacillus foliorum]|nr:hypothetical protein [Paenibacillus foliorum]